MRGCWIPAAFALWFGLSGCARERPRAVVVIVVDQLRTDYLERFKDHYRGGFRRLLEGGAWFPEALFRHSSTFTGAGHATIATGMHPATHGIVGNSWRESGRGPVYCVEDDRYASVGGSGQGVSPRALLVETLGDRLKRDRPGSKVYAFSTKDRSAVLMAGAKGDGAFWYQPECGCLVSSTYYADSLPDWLVEVGPEASAMPYAGRVWTKLLDDELYERLSRRDPFLTEADGTLTVFPHRLATEEFESEIRGTPFADEITLAAASALLRSGQIGTDGDPDLLFLGLSATDAIGHRYGPFSQEAMDNHLRLDRALAGFFDVVDEAVGLDRVVFALTADHGAVPLVEHLAEQGVAAQRFMTDDLWQRAKRVIAECGAAPAEETVAASGGRTLYWNEAALRDRGIDRADASACLARWLGGQDGVESVFTAEDIADGGAGGVARLFGNAYFEGRSPHVQLHLSKYYHPDARRGTGHGSAHDYDRRVPVLLWGRGIEPGFNAGPAGPEDIAPTLGRILGLDMPLESDTRVLDEALQ